MRGSGPGYASVHETMAVRCVDPQDDMQQGVRGDRRLRNRTPTPLLLLFAATDVLSAYLAPSLLAREVVDKDRPTARPPAGPEAADSPSGLMSEQQAQNEDTGMMKPRCKRKRTMTMSNKSSTSSDGDEKATNITETEDASREDESSNSLL